MLRGISRDGDRHEYMSPNIPYNFLQGNASNAAKRHTRASSSNSANISEKLSQRVSPHVEREISGAMDGSDRSSRVTQSPTYPRKASGYSVLKVVNVSNLRKKCLVSDCASYGSNHERFTSNYMN